MPEWTWARASRRGLSHMRLETRRQDALSCLSPNSESFAAVICDGAGSAEGASLTARTIIRRAADFLRNQSGMPDDGLLWSWTDEARDRLLAVSEKQGKPRKDYAATLVAVVANNGGLVTMHIGDGAVVGRDAESGSWGAISWPHHGEYASTTYFITDDPIVQLRITRSPPKFSAIALFSDGIERLALSFSENLPHIPFFNGIIRPLDASSALGCDLGLCRRLEDYLDTEAINSRTDDDKSLILAVLR
jgi:hypothetical protein